MPPTYVLKEGDVVEILTSPEMLDVDPDLEELCKTPKARTTINKLLQQKRRQYAREVGREIMAQEISLYGLSPEILEEEKTRLILEILNMKDLSELYVHIGQDQLSPHAFFYYFLEPSSLNQSQDQSRASAALPPFHERNVLKVSEIDKGIHKFARCCNPYPAQQNAVAVLSERGVTFHREDCEELHRHNLHSYQILKVEWIKDVAWRYSLLFHVHIRQETPISLCPSISSLSSNFRILKLESAKKKSYQPFTMLAVELRNFQEAQDLFENLPDNRIVIKKYYRQRGSQSNP
jgi:GTP pyrophosphokinase